MKNEKTREEELEAALKELLFYLELHYKECNEKGIDDRKEDPTSWAYNIREMLRGRLGHDHSGFAGYNFKSILYVWLVIEVWKNGRIIPRCVTLTEPEAKRAKDLLLYSYESKEPKNRPEISIEHQRTEHIFGFSMKGWKYDGLYPRGG